MEKQKKGKILIGFIIFTSLLLIGTIVFSLMRHEEPYRYFTGLGSTFELSPDDEQYLLSYYIDGKESIYQANVDGSDVMKLTDSPNERHHQPRYSNDGETILFLANNNEERINTLYTANSNGSEPKRVSPVDTHVSEAVFSATGEEIYFVGIPAEEYNKAEGEATEGYDLYVAHLADGKVEQITDKDHFTMNFLSVSHNGKEVYYSLFDGTKEKVTAFSIEDRTEKSAPGANQLPTDTYWFRYSPDGTKIAYTTVSDESRDTSLFQYELFLFDIESGVTKRLTHLESSVVSPRFFKNQNKIAFLEYTNWPGAPEEHALKIVDIETEEIQEIKLALSSSNSNHFWMKTLDTFANGNTLMVFYVVLLALVSTYLGRYQSKKKSYLPATASLILALVVFISSFIVGFTVDPWYGIGLGMLAAAILGCTVVVFIYSFVLNLFIKRK